MEDTYTPVNPTVEGTLNLTFTSKTPLDAAISFWETLSSNEIIVGSVPVFYFSLKDQNDNMFHFVVKEKIGANK